jgi:predicted O-methyltransferase YrrM
MNQAMQQLKDIWIFNFLRRILNFSKRIFHATKYYNHKYYQIVRWGISSKEITNYTYALTSPNIIYLAHTIAVITNVDYKKVMEYFNEIEEDAFLKNFIIESTKKSKYRYIADLEMHFGRRIGWYALARILKPKVTIETGVDKGLGSVVLCTALLKNEEEGHEGRYYGTDINPDAGFLLSDKYKQVGEIIYGDSIETLKNFDKNIDLFINDSDHSEEYEYQEYLTIKNNITNETIILGDNSHITNKLALFSNENNRSFLFFKEEPLNHWYPGGGIGISFVGKQ